MILQVFQTMKMCWKLCLAKKSFRIFIVLKYANKHDSFVCCGRVIFCKVKEASLFSISMKYSGFMIFFLCVNVTMITQYGWTKFQIFRSESVTVKTNFKNCFLHVIFHLQFVLLTQQLMIFLFCDFSPILRPFDCNV